MTPLHSWNCFSIQFFTSPDSQHCVHRFDVGNHGFTLQILLALYTNHAHHAQVDCGTPQPIWKGVGSGTQCSRAKLGAKHRLMLQAKPGRGFNHSAVSLSLSLTSLRVENRTCVFSFFIGGGGDGLITFMCLVEKRIRSQFQAPKMGLVSKCAKSDRIHQIDWIFQI